MSTYQTIFVTLRQPRDGDCGIVEEGRYRIEGSTVILVDINGKPRLDKKGKRIQQKLNGENARTIAARLVRDHLPDRRGDFNRRIVYPDMGKF